MLLFLVVTNLLLLLLVYYNNIGNVSIFSTFFLCSIHVVGTQVLMIG